MNILEDRKDTEECVNDTYLRAWNTIPPILPQHLRACLERISRSLALNCLRTAGRRIRPIETAVEELAECLPAPEEQVRNAVVSVCGDDTALTMLDPASCHMEVTLIRKDTPESDDAEMLFSRLNQTFLGQLNTASIYVYTSRKDVEPIVSYTMDYRKNSMSGRGDVGPGPYVPQ